MTSAMRSRSCRKTSSRTECRRGQKRRPCTDQKAGKSSEYHEVAHDLDEASGYSGAGPISSPEQGLLRIENRRGEHEKRCNRHHEVRRVARKCSQRRQQPRQADQKRQITDVPEGGSSTVNGAIRRTESDIQASGRRRLWCKKSRARSQSPAASPPKHCLLDVVRIFMKQGRCAVRHFAEEIEAIRPPK